MIDVGLRDLEAGGGRCLSLLKNYLLVKDSWAGTVANYFTLADSGATIKMTYDIETTYISNSFLQ